jgi:hypothetical protein
MATTTSVPRWDLAFLAAGVVLAVAGWLLQRRAPARPPASRHDTSSR